MNFVIVFNVSFVSYWRCVVIATHIRLQHLTISLNLDGEQQPQCLYSSYSKCSDGTHAYQGHELPRTSDHIMSKLSGEVHSQLPTTPSTQTRLMNCNKDT